MPAGMAEIILWRRRAIMSEARQMAPTDGEFRMLVKMFEGLEANMAHRFSSLDTRLDRQDELMAKNREAFTAGIKETNVAVGELRQDVALAKTGIAIGQWVVGLLGVGGLVSAWRWLVGAH
jgi:hypothetical protein